MEENESHIGDIKPIFLKCEYLINPLGIDIVDPRLSWVLESDKRNKKQTAYHILVASNEEILNEDRGDLWDSGKVITDESTHIIYQGKELKSQIFCYWKVRVWDGNDKPSDWSKNAKWSMGLLKDDDWKAKWIGTSSKSIFWINKVLPKKDNPCPLLRKSFQFANKAKRAIVYVTALGEYELYLNGKRVSDHILAPEWTDYDKRVQYQTYDVTDLLVEGENVIGAILADGWYIGNLGPGMPPYLHHFYGENRRLLLQMEIEQFDGTIKEIVSDSDWKILEDGPIEVADHFTGETYNVQKEIVNWDKSGFDDSEWSHVTIDSTIDNKIVAQMNEPIRIVKEIKPIEVTEPNPGEFVFNLGQNIAGWCRISLDKSICDANAIITLRHGEMLNPDGTLYTKNLRNAKATDTYILKGIEKREYQPHFTYHGFQYVEVKGLKPGIKPNLDMITGCVVASDARLVGGFESSDPTVNKLWNNILWTQRDNMISVPTDCHQRNERMGWMGDALVFCQMSIFNMDMAAFYTKWIQDIRDAQSDEGRYTDMSPTPYRIKGLFKLVFLGAPAWADCGIHLPWDVYLNYGDKRLIEQHFDSAKKYIDYVHSKNQNLIWIRRRGNNYGDWLNGNEIKSEDYPKKGGEVPKEVLSTAFFAHSTEILSKMAEIIGLKDKFEYYDNLARQIREKFTERFVKNDGKIKGDTQAGYAIALHFNLLPEELRPKAVKHMLNAIERYDGRISTGFLCTLPMMLELTRWGHNDTAYQLLLSRKFPSWFYMIDQGATTMWERWDGYVKGRGFQNKSMNSFCHYAFGSVGEWIIKVILGIDLDENQPGYKHIIVRPRPNGAITWAKGYYDSIRGKIDVDWSLQGKKFNLEIKIPPNTTATVYLPASNLENITENDKSIHESDDIELKKYEANLAILKINSGKYSFISSM